MKKKILFIITYPEMGGAQKQLLYLIEGLNKDKYSLYLCSGDKGFLKDKFSGLSFLNTCFLPEMTRDINPFYDIIAFAKLYIYIKRNAFDIIHTHSPKASMLGRWAAFLAGRRSIVYTVHGWPFHGFMNPLLRHLCVFLEKVTALITRRIVTVSYADLYKGVKNRVSGSDKFVIIHYGLDTGKAGDIFSKRSSSPTADNLIVNVSCLKRQKGLTDFLDAAELVLRRREDAKFLIIGDGPLRKKLEREIAKRGLANSVWLKGWMGDLSETLARASLLAISSLWEGLPLAVIEAVASGVPVVATDTEGIRDIIKKGSNAIPVGLRDADAMASAVLRIMDKYDSWNRRVLSARKRFDSDYWSKERMVTQTEKLYQEVLA